MLGDGVACWWYVLVLVLRVECCVLVLGVGVGCWCCVLVLGVGVGCWVLVLGVGVGCWCSVLVLRDGVECWWYVLVLGVGVGCWCCVLVLDVGAMCSCCLLVLRVVGVVVGPGYVEVDAAIPSAVDVSSRVRKIAAAFFFAAAGSHLVDGEHSLKALVLLAVPLVVGRRQPVSMRR